MKKIEGNLLKLVALVSLDYQWYQIFYSLKKEPFVIILHTNDTHSHIFPINNGKYKGFGGMAQTKQLIKDIRKDNRNVLLLDA